MICLQWNVNGYFQRLPEIKQLIQTYHPIVLALQETHLLPKHRTSLSRYNTFRSDNLNNIHNHASGGVALLVDNSYKAKAIPTPSQIQNVAVSISMPQFFSLPISVCSIYIPPHKIYQRRTSRISVTSFRNLSSCVGILTPTALRGVVRKQTLEVTS